MDNRTRLRAHLGRLSWTQRELAEWLTDQGEPIATRTVERWFHSGSSGRKCPAWPSLLIESRRPQK